MRHPRRCHLGDLRERRAHGRIGEASVRHDGNRRQAHQHIDHGRAAHRQNDAPRHGAFGIFHLLRQIEQILEPHECIKGQDRSRHDQRQRQTARFRGRFQIIHSAEIPRTHGNDKQQSAHLDGGADHVDPHTLANAAQIHPSQCSNESQKNHPERNSAHHRLQGRGKNPAARGHRSQPGTRHGQTDYIGKEFPTISPLGDERRTRRARIPRSQRRVGESGQQRRHHGDRKPQPDRVAHFSRRHADRPVDPRADHVAHAVNHQREQPDGPGQPRVVLALAHPANLSACAGKRTRKTSGPRRGKDCQIFFLPIEEWALP